MQGLVPSDRLREKRIVQLRGGDKHLLYHDLLPRSVEEATIKASVVWPSNDASTTEGESGGGSPWCSKRKGRRLFCASCSIPLTHLG